MAVSDLILTLNSDDEAPAEELEEEPNQRPDGGPARRKSAKEEVGKASKEKGKGKGKVKGQKNAVKRKLIDMERDDSAGSDSDGAGNNKRSKTKGKEKTAGKDGEMNASFTFDGMALGGGWIDENEDDGTVGGDWMVNSTSLAKRPNAIPRTTVDDIIARRRLQKKATNGVKENEAEGGKNAEASKPTADDEEPELELLQDEGDEEVDAEDEIAAALGENGDDDDDDEEGIGSDGGDGSAMDDDEEDEINSDSEDDDDDESDVELGDNKKKRRKIEENIDPDFEEDKGDFLEARDVKANSSTANKQANDEESDIDGEDDVKSSEEKVEANPFTALLDFDEAELSPESSRSPSPAPNDKNLSKFKQPNGNDNSTFFSSHISHVPSDIAQDPLHGARDPNNHRRKNKGKEAANGVSNKGKSKGKEGDMMTFGDMRLARGIMLGLKEVGMQLPTAIQKEVIPVALSGKDIVGSSQTGSGKTASFVLPILERLHHRPRNPPQTRVLVLAPTRELVVQIDGVVKALGRFTDVKVCCCVGGLSLNVQASQLRQKPDVVVSTPGRLIDHLRNSPGFDIDGIEILVIDEADRMLEEGFRDELEEIVKCCPRGRQTMLFSATVTEDVSELARLSLNKPVRIKIDHLAQTASLLTQEFIRVRAPANSRLSGTDTDAVAARSKAQTRVREAALIALCLKAAAFNQGSTLIFFRSKAQAHRMKIIFTLLGEGGGGGNDDEQTTIKTNRRLPRAEELHGDLTQEQRLTSLQNFKERKCGYLLATDLASRGLDIKGVENVINFEMPRDGETYLHRVGRTARAGRDGRSVTLVGEPDRKLVKEVVKLASTDSVQQRVIPPDTLKEMHKLVQGLDDEVTEILQEEEEEKEMRKAEMELRKGQNMMEHRDEIKGRAPRTWFQSNAEKAKAKGNKKAGTSDEPSKPSRKKLNHRERRRAEAKAEGGVPSMSSSIRTAKKAALPGKINQIGSTGGVDITKQRKEGKSDKKRKRGGAKGGGGGSFKRELGSKPHQTKSDGHGGGLSPAQKGKSKSGAGPKAKASRRR